MKKGENEKTIKGVQFKKPFRGEESTQEKHKQRRRGTERSQKSWSSETSWTQWIMARSEQKRDGIKIKQKYKKERKELQLQSSKINKADI